MKVEETVAVGQVNNSLPPPPPYEAILLSSTQAPHGVTDYVPYQFTEVHVPTALPGQTGVNINPIASAGTRSLGFNFHANGPQQQPAIPSLPPAVDDGAQPQQYSQQQPSAQQYQQSAVFAAGPSDRQDYQPQITRDSSGIETDDEHLNKDHKALLNFFVNNCSPPQLFVNIRGHHTEHRTRTVTRHHDGRTTYHTEHYTVDVTDFEQLYDLTPYIDPTGTIYTVPDEQNNFLTVPQLLEKYTKDENVFKSLVLTKYVQWDFTELQQAIIGAIRNAGFYKQITITFPKQQHEVSVHSAHCMGRFARNTWVRVLCVLSCLWVVACPIYMCSRHRMADTLLADFKMRITPKDWFYTNYQTIMTNIRY
jgi:hypothetical protein